MRMSQITSVARKAGGYNEFRKTGMLLLRPSCTFCEFVHFQAHFLIAHKFPVYLHSVLKDPCSAIHFISGASQLHINDIPINSEPFRSVYQTVILSHLSNSLQDRELVRILRCRLIRNEQLEARVHLSYLSININKLFYTFLWFHFGGMVTTALR